MKSKTLVIAESKGEATDVRGGFSWAGSLDTGFRRMTLIFALITVVVLAAMAWQMVVGSLPAMHRFGWAFVTGTDWNPVIDSFGALPYIYGTLASSLLALCFALPVAAGAAVYIVELAPGWVKRPIGFLIETLAAIPSVIYGLWGIFIVVPWLRESVQPLLSKHLGFLPFFQGAPIGFSLLAGALVLAIMILPTIASVTRDVLESLPSTLREGALALGSTRWEMIRKILLPAARSGILGAVILGLGRALGETMAVTMVIGNRAQISASLLDPSYSLASVIANEYAEASGDLHLAALTEIGLLLFGVTLVLNIIARLFIWRLAKRGA